MPTETKTLHLYEARYLALLDEVIIYEFFKKKIFYGYHFFLVTALFLGFVQSMKRKKNMFVHFILDPISISEKATEASFAARYGCLVVIENVSFFFSKENLIFFFYLFLDGFRSS